VSDEEALRRKKGGSFSVKEAVPWKACLLVVSNQAPASLLSPELAVLASSLGDTLEGGLAWLLAAVGELAVAVVAAGFRWVRALDELAVAGGLCRNETDWWAGGRRGCCLASFMAGAAPSRLDTGRCEVTHRRRRSGGGGGGCGDG